MRTLVELAPLHGISSGTQKPLHDKTMSRQLQVLTKHPGFQRREHSAVKLRGAIIEKARVRRLIDKAERRSVEKLREEFVVLVGDHNGDDDDGDDDDDEDGDDSPLSLNHCSVSFLKSDSSKAKTNSQLTGSVDIGDVNRCCTFLFYAQVG